MLETRWRPQSALPVVVNSDDVSRNVRDRPRLAAARRLPPGRTRSGSRRCRCRVPFSMPISSIGGNNRYLLGAMPQKKNLTFGHLIVFEIKNSNTARSRWIIGTQTTDEGVFREMQVRIGAKAMVAAWVPRPDKFHRSAHHGGCGFSHATRHRTNATGSADAIGKNPRSRKANTSS